MPITLRLERIAGRKGHANEWECTSDGFIPGSGRTRTEAQGNFFSANFPRFGVARQVDLDHESTTPEVVWESKGPVAVPEE